MYEYGEGVGEQRAEDMLRLEMEERRGNG